MSGNTKRPFSVKVVYRRRYASDDHDAAGDQSHSIASEATDPRDRVYENQHKVKEHVDTEGSAQVSNKSVDAAIAPSYDDTGSRANLGGTESAKASGEPFDVLYAKPATIWEYTNVDSDHEDEAPVPGSFKLIEDEEDDFKLQAQKHISSALPDFYSLDKVPDDLTTLPPLEYYPLDPTVDPVRLVVILPHFGNPFSTVECNLFPVSLKDKHYCFAAIMNTRGHKHLTSHIIVNNCVKQVTRNLEVFLRHFRQQQFAMVVWIRELCIDVCDFPEHRTPVWRDSVFSRACKRLDMSNFMYKLQSDGILDKEKQFTIRPKDWVKVAREVHLPTSYPIALRTFTNEQLEGKETDIPIIPHEYLPLDLVAEEIRLIVIMPSADPDAPVVAHLAYESLHGPAAYECLSYTWGEGEASEDLILNSQLFKIRENLCSALKAIRHREPGRFVTLWVDAVCINQTDMAERSRQVSRMHQIYEMADAVLVWLGSSSDDSDLAMDFAQQLRQSNEIAFEIVSDSQEMELIRTETTAKQWAALSRLLLRPYFRRLWIVQELTLASVPTAFCGSKQVSWHDIHNASLILQLHRTQIQDLCAAQDFPLMNDILPSSSEHEGCPNCFQPRLAVQDLTLPHKLSWHREMRRRNQRPSFLYLCLLNRDAECNNPRDKIFALWNLAREADELQSFVPDYSSPIRDVYIAFTKAYIETTRSLDIICTPGNYCNNGGEPLDLPSWVVDWRFRSAVNSYIRPDGLPIADSEELIKIGDPIYHCARSTTAVIDFFGETHDTLVCAGIIVDTIKYVSTERMDPEKWFDEAKEFCHHDGHALSYDELNRQFTSMTLGDATCSWEADSSRSRARWIDRGLGKQDVLSKQVQVMPGKVVQSPIRARSFVVTTKGYMGLAPYWVQPGFELAILMGCSVPVLLEKHGSHCHVKGDCFVQGWMNGEMLDALNMTDEEVMQHVAQKTPPIVLH